MNMKKTVVNIVCTVGDALKPVLLKILPKSLLKRMKGSLIASAYSANAKLPFEKDSYPFGINLIGYIRAQMGLGQGCRLMAQAVKQTGIPFLILDTRVGNPFHHDDHSWDEHIRKVPEYSVNIFHVNPEQMPPLQLSLPADTLDRRYNIGIWLWELEDFPDEWLGAFSLVDEVWAPSVFNCESIRKKSPVPVTLIPYGIEAECDDSLTRADFGLPEGIFLFLAMYDANSTIQRKNPLGAVEAFKKAFPPEDSSVGLVLKVNNPTPADMDTLQQALLGYENIYLIQQTLPKTGVNALIRLCDAFVSLHRAEGFGLVIAEAMLVGTPVVATNWSANVDFMNAENSCPVDYELKELGEDFFLYKAYQRWAEPDTAHAARYMKRLASDREFYENLRQNAQDFISAQYSPAKSAEAVKQRLAAIFEGNLPLYS